MAVPGGLWAAWVLPSGPAVSGLAAANQQSQTGCPYEAFAEAAVRQVSVGRPGFQRGAAPAAWREQPEMFPRAVPAGPVPPAATPVRRQWNGQNYCPWPEHLEARPQGALTQSGPGQKGGAVLRIRDRREDHRPVCRRPPDHFQTRPRRLKLPPVLFLAECKPCPTGRQAQISWPPADF